MKTTRRLEVADGAKKMMNLRGGLRIPLRPRITEVRHHTIPEAMIPGLAEAVVILAAADQPEAWTNRLRT